MYANLLLPTAGANLNIVDNNLPDANFGKATLQYTPRYLQFGGNPTF